MTVTGMETHNCQQLLCYAIVININEMVATNKNLSKLLAAISFPIGHGYKLALYFDEATSGPGATMSSHLHELSGMKTFVVGCATHTKETVCSTTFLNSNSMS